MATRIRRRRRRRTTHSGWKVLLIAAAGVAAVMLVAVGAGASWAIKQYNKAPPLSSLHPIKKGRSSAIYASDGSLIGFIHSSTIRQPLGWNGIPSDLKDATIGVQVGTTSLDAVNAVIKPSNQPRVYNDSNDVVRALKSKQVDAIVVDLPTAIYLRDAEVEGSKIVGQFAAPGGDDWGLVMAKDSPLTACVSKAVTDLKSSGQLTAITDQWIGAEAPVLALQ